MGQRMTRKRDELIDDPLIRDWRDDVLVMLDLLDHEDEMQMIWSEFENALSDAENTIH